MGIPADHLDPYKGQKIDTWIVVIVAGQQNPRRSRVGYGGSGYRFVNLDPGKTYTPAAGRGSKSSQKSL